MKHSATVLFLSLLLAGSLLALAFAPWSCWPLAILSPSYLLWIWQHPRLTPSPKRAFEWGMIYGLGFYGLGVSWVFVSIHRYGNTDAILAVLLTGLFICILALLMGLQGYLVKRIYREGNLSFCLVGFPCLWILFEWFRSILLSGFPWLFLGYSQLSTPLSGFASIGSVYAVSLAVAVSCGACIVLLQTPIIKFRMLVSLLVVSIWGGGEFFKTLVWTTPHAQATTISLVQGNIEPFDKFTQQDPIQAARRSYEKLSAPHWGSQLILWPENAIAYPIPYVNAYLAELKHLAQSRQSTLITGLQTIVSQKEYYNSMIALGVGSGIYHKRILVPFGEYLPIEALRGLINFFDIPMSSFTTGPKEQALLQAGELKLAPLMCYEIAFPELVRETVRNADFLITLSEDGWFGDSWGPHQHLEIARMRALEVGRPVLRATTSGISAIIDANGQLLAQSPQFQTWVLEGSVPGRQGETPWQKIGLWPWLGFCLLGLLAQFQKSFFKTFLQNSAFVGQIQARTRSQSTP